LAEAICDTVQGSEELSMAMGRANHPVFTFPKQHPQSLAWLHEWGGVFTTEHPPCARVNAEPLKGLLEAGRRAQPSSPPPLLSLWF